MLELYENRVDDSVPSWVPRIRVSIDSLFLSNDTIPTNENEALDNIIDWLIILAPDNNIEDKGCENINGTEVETENEDFVSRSNIYIYWS